MNIVVSLDFMLTLRLLNRVLSPFLHCVETATFENPFNNVTAEPCKYFKKKGSVSVFLEAKSL